MSDQELEIQTEADEILEAEAVEEVIESDEQEQEESDLQEKKSV